MATNTTRKACSVKPTADSDQSKQVVVEIDWTGMSLEATRDLAAKDIVIRVQGSLRKKWAKVKPGEVMKVDAVNYTTTSVDPIAMLNAVPKSERAAWLKARGIEI